MEQLNTYLQSLISSRSDELRLEPNKNPYLVVEDRTTDVSSTPLLGTQISTMVFPLIPPDIRSSLPNRSEIEFVHPHDLGHFNFVVQKSTAGFNVTIRPVTTKTSEQFIPPQRTATEPPAVRSEYNQAPPAAEAAPQLEFNSGAEAPAAPSYEFESVSSSRDLSTTESSDSGGLSGSGIESFESAAEYTPDDDIPEIEVLPVNDPQFHTVFSDASTYEPPGSRADFLDEEYVPPTQSTFVPTQNLTYTEQSPMLEYTPEPQQPVSPPMEYVPAPPESVPPPTYSPRTAQPAVQTAAIEPEKSRSRLRMEALFNLMAELGASDLHMSVSMPPMIRKDGKMQQLQATDSQLTSEAMSDLLTSIMPPRNQQEFAERHDTDFAYEIPGLARFRCNIFMDRKGMGGVFRIIPSKILTAAELGLSKAIMDLCSLSKGLVVVTGPTGSGKSTTLCAMVDWINHGRQDHIITIEDPIEFVHENQKCLVNQREVHNHTDSFKDALRAALREDPDIVLVGEMRDLETISIAIETAETGHLVFGTLHTTTAPSTVDRIIDQFPADRQQQIRVMLSESLKGVIAQTLLPKKGGGRVAALEVLIVTPAVSNLIREGKTFQIPSAMQTGRAHGMVMLNDSLFEHVQNGTVEPLDAYIKAVDKTGFESMLTRGGFKL
jgi:twitching motility protein PilT